MADIMKWPEVPGFGSLQREMDKFFEDFFRRSGLQARWGPAVDVVEKAGSVIVRAELPGVEPEDVDISVSGNTLTIKGEKKEEKEEKGKSYYRVERSYGSFCRTINLPDGVVADKAKADYKDGVLQITLPRSEKLRTKKIPIKTDKTDKAG